MIAALLRLELRRTRLLVGWLLLLVVAYSAILAIVYPAIRANAANLDLSMKAYPKDFMAAFGMEASLSDPGVYYTADIGILLWPVVAAIAGIALATRPTAVDTERGWIETPMSGHLSRVAYALVSVVVQALTLAVLSVATVGAFVGVGALVGANLNAGPFALAAFAAWLFGCAIASVAMLIGVATLNRGVAAGITAGGLIVMYVFRIVGTVQPDLGWLANLSAFRYLYPTHIIDMGTLPWDEVLGFAVLTIAAWGIAVALFRQRDLVA